MIRAEDGDEDEDEESDKYSNKNKNVEGKKNSTKTEILDKVHKEESSNYLLDHTHKFVQNKVFD